MQMAYVAAARGEGSPGALPAGGEADQGPDSSAAAEELARVLLDSPLGGVVVTDRAGRVRHLNAIAERASGWSGAQARGMPVAEVLRLVDAQTQAPVPCPVARALAEEREVRFTGASLVSREGWQTPVRGTAAPTRGRERGPSGAVLVFQDITEQRQLERHLAYHSRQDTIAAAASRVGIRPGPDADAVAAERELALQWVPRIRAALRDDRFAFRSQEIRPLDRRSAPMHYEVLVRMLDERGEEVTPGEFIPVAERQGLMPELDRWIIRSVFRMLARGRSDTGRAPGATYCINLSGASLGDPTLVDFIRDEMTRVRVPPQSICFEITETSAVTNLAEAGVLTRSLKALGFKLALDDFGAGLSSFAYLKSLAVDYLKIEGGFVRDMASNRESRAIVEAINSVGHALGLRSIAECVESRATLAELREIGVDFAQGYGLSRPQPLRE